MCHMKEGEKYSSGGGGPFQPKDQIIKTTQSVQTTIYYYNPVLSSVAGQSATPSVDIHPY